MPVLATPYPQAGADSNETMHADLLLLSSFLHLRFRLSCQGIALPTTEVDLSPSTKEIKIILHRHVQISFSMVILDCVKSTTEINHHTKNTEKFFYLRSDFWSSR